MKLKMQLSCCKICISPIIAFADSYEPDTLTVSASQVKASGKFEAISKVESIDANTKRLNGTSSLGGALSDIVGVNSISTGSQTGKPVIRGVSGELPFTNFEIETLTAMIGYKIDSGEITAGHSYYEGYQTFRLTSQTPRTLQYLQRVKN